MIDQTIKRAIIITFIVVIVARLSSFLFDVWMGETQDEMIANQQTLSDFQQGLAATENEARLAEYRINRCHELMQAAPCLRPTDFEAVGECLLSLDHATCDELPHVHLCSAVEELEVCADPFEDQKANGCDRLRRYASCRKKPATADRDGLWKIVLDDGMWHGE